MMITSKHSSSTLFSLCLIAASCDAPLEESPVGDDVDVDDLVEMEEANESVEASEDSAPQNHPSPLSELAAVGKDSFMCPPYPEPCHLPEPKPPSNPYPIPAGTTCYRATGPTCPSLCLDGGAWFEPYDCKTVADFSKVQGWVKLDSLNKIWVFFDPYTSGVPVQIWNVNGSLIPGLKKQYNLRYPPVFYPYYDVEWFANVNNPAKLFEKYVK